LKAGQFSEAAVRLQVAANRLKGGVNPNLEGWLLDQAAQTQTSAKSWAAADRDYADAIAI
jgi:hypothetical protein